MKLLNSILFLVCISANAYIPSPDFIIGKTVKNSGQGVYQIKQDLQFPLPDKTVSVTETWWVSGPDLQFVKIDGLLFTQYYLYKNGKKYSFNNQGQLVASANSPFFAEPFFFYRNSQDLKTALLQKKLAPAQAFKKRPTFKTKQELDKWNEPFLGLSRFKGSVTYVLGFAAQNSAQPGIWIEQDRFVVRKIKLSQDAEISVESVSELSKSLSYPKTKIYTWQNGSVQADLTRGDSLKSGTEFFNENEFSKLANQNRELPQEYKGSLIEEFYKRFR